MLQNFHSKLIIACLIVFGLQAAGCARLTRDANSTSAANNGTATNSSHWQKDDFTSDLAVQIMRRAKVAEIKSILNAQINPCDDFYKFACGNWHRSNPAQLLGNIITDKFQQLAKAFDRRLDTLLNEPRRGDLLEYKLKDFYQACRVVKDDQLLYKADLEAVYKEFGEMPVFLGNSWAGEQDFNWLEVVANIYQRYGKHIILALDIMSDVKNGTDNRLYIGPPDFTVMANTKLFNILQESATAHGLEKVFGVESGVAKSTAKEMIELERELMGSGTDSSLGLSLEESLVEVNVSDLAATYAEHVDMRKYLELVLGNSSEVPEAIYLYDSKYLQGALAVIAKTPKRILANYILWQLLQDFLVEVKRSDLPRWCIEKTKKFFGKYADYAVYQRYKNKAVEADVLQMWEEIRATFREELLGDKLDWIANATRAYAVEKLNAMQLQINSYEDEDFNGIYAELKIDRLNYVKNVQNVLILENSKKLQGVKGPSLSYEPVDILTFTPAYNVLTNVIKLPVGMLQPHHLWDAKYPQSFKYATLGYLVAHEMIHGFDDDGRNFDKHGKQLSWWDVKSQYGFEERRKCFQAQYHGYKYAGKQLPESVAQSENIADNAAVKLAYSAYNHWLQSRKADDAEEALALETLPGLHYDSSQLFFISYAQMWCDDVQTLFRSSVAASDTHAPSKYRVIGTLSNFQEFSWVFQCPQDAPMDPEFKCAIY